MKNLFFLFFLSLIIFSSSSCNKDATKKLSASQLVKQHRDYVQSEEMQKLIEKLTTEFNKNPINKNLELRDGRDPDTGCCVCTYFIDNIVVSSPAPAEYYWELEGAGICPDSCAGFRAIFSNSDCYTGGGPCEDVISIPGHTYYPFNCCVAPNSWVIATGIGFGFGPDCDPDIDNTYTITYHIECYRKYNTNPHCNVSYVPITPTTVVLTSSNLTSGIGAIKLGGECGCQPVSTIH